MASTNSISQGESVATLWKPLFEEGIHIDFAHRTFRWDSEASIKAHVHSVIIGFSFNNSIKNKIIFTSERPLFVDNINAYLKDAPNVFKTNRNTPLCNVNKMDFGSMPNDGGYLSDYSTEQKDEIVSNYPELEELFKKLVGAQEFINKKERWCLWLHNVSPLKYYKNPFVNDVISKVRELRENSSREATKKLAETPMLFGEIRQPSTEYLLVPSTSSENRKYIPIGFMSKDIISNNANLLVPNASLYDSAVMTSNVHNAWMRAVCGRLKSDYRYSVKVVYNNFPWPKPTDEQKAEIERTAQAILDARNLYDECSLADLYGEKLIYFSSLL